MQTTTNNNESYKMQINMMQMEHKEGKNFYN
jgi:hypothetical protein